MSACRFYSCVCKQVNRLDQLDGLFSFLFFLSIEFLPSIKNRLDEISKVNVPPLLLTMVTHIK